MKPQVSLSVSQLRTFSDSRTSPFGAEAEHIAEAFARRYELIPSNYHAFASMSRFAYRNAVSAERLAVASMVHNLFFVLDDILFDQVLLPEEYGLDANAVGNPAPLLGDLTQVLLTGQVNRGLTPLHEAVAELHVRLMSFVGPDWLRLFVKAINGYLSAAATRGAYDYLNSLSAFLAARDLDTGGYQTVLLGEVTNDVVLPMHLRQDRLLKELTWLTYRTAAWVNDIISYPKDVWEEGTDFNLVYVLEVQEGSLDAAVEHAIAMVNRELDYFESLEAQLLSLPLGQDQLVLRYVTMLKDLMSGNTHWHAYTPRYRHPFSPFVELRLNV
ncbi:MAG: hypothetical protein GYB68_08410 [Chloroflexi bacterium]|nr:hypothetical protein [Chloroflexota bacterium]